MTTLAPTNDDIEQRDALLARLFEASIATMEVFCAYIGERLGLYRTLADRGAATSIQLAAATGTHERYTREWLEQQAATGILTCANPEADTAERRYALPATYHEVFLDGNSLNYFGGILRLVTGVTRPVDAVLAAFRSGGGVPYADYGEDTHEGIATMNRPMFLHALGSEWLPAMPEIDSRLRQAYPPARVADIGCGAGWSAIAIARAYPHVRVDGLDLDAGSIARARQNAGAEGVADRVSFEVRDAADPALAGRYELVTAFETLHDMARPVAALRAMRALLAEGGAALIADENVGETFAVPGTDVERLNYAFSVLHCLPATMAENGPPEQATGTVMRPETLRRYAAAAGFSRVEALPIENGFWRFYRLTP